MNTTLKSYQQAFLLTLAVLLLGGCGTDDPPADQHVSGEALPQYQRSDCTRYGEIELAGQYMVQNNIWNDDVAATQTQCVTALWDGESPVAGMVVDPVEIDAPERAASYPAIVYGWHWGPFHGAYSEARRFEDIIAIPTSWRFSVPSEARYAVEYDLWLHPTSSPPDGDGTLELMIWVAHRDATPIGELIDTVEIEGGDWEVWYGPNGTFWSLTYRRVENLPEVAFDIVPFVADGLERAEASSDWYLLGIEAGFELWHATDRFTTHNYEVRIE